MLKKYAMGLIIVALLAFSALIIYNKLNPEKLADNLISGTGNMDGDIILLNTKYPGRIEKNLAEDGQVIKKGEVVAVLSSDEYIAKLQALKESIKSAKNGLVAMGHEYEIAKESIPLEIKRAEYAVAISRAQKDELDDSLDTLENLVAQDERDYERTKTLHNKKLIGKQKLELAELKLSSDTNKLLSLKEKKVQIIKSIEISQTTLKLAQIQMKKLLSLLASIDATKNKIDALEANKKELEIIISKLTIKSPIDGVVIEKIAHVGEVISSGMIVSTLIDPHSLYLKLFVDTLENGKIKIGDKGVIFLDSNPDMPIAAKVVNIAQRAEFTPKEVSVRSDRIQRVFSIHLKPLKINPLLKLGIPAVGVISTDGKSLPNSLKEIPSI